MSYKSQILELTKRLDDLPVRHETLLKAFLVDLKLTIKDIFGPGNQYLDYLKFVKFRPDAVFVTERELQRSWLAGKAQVVNLLRVIVNDPIVRASEPTESLIEPPSEEEVSIRRFSDIQDSILGVLDGFQKEVLNRPPADEHEGPIKDPLRKDFFGPPAATLAAEPPEPRPLEAVALEPSADQTQRRIFLVPGSDQLLNQDVFEFLSATCQVVKKDDDRRRGEVLLDQLNRAAAMDFAVFLLDPDFFFYPRTQTHESARLMAGQDLIFQLGFLVAKLGRERVVVLYHESDHFRRPTDYFDIHYVPLGRNTAWKADLVKRLKACGVIVVTQPDFDTSLLHVKPPAPAA
jgi:predicted nucleotide-binding protein